ncbi:MAG: DUF948 domain-containing protein [bacterium]|nr:DUF948 domain-containing protein [bacterium]
MTDRELLEMLVQSVNGINKRLDSMQNEINSLRTEMNERFEEVNKRFEKVDERFEEVNKRFDAVEERLDRIERDIRFNRHTEADILDYVERRVDLKIEMLRRELKAA